MNPIRRHLLVASTAIPILLSKASHIYPIKGLDRLLYIYTDDEAAHGIGVAFLELYAGDLPGTIEKLMTRMAMTSTELESISDVTLRRRADDVIRADFEGGRMVNIDGWLMALTEAQLCALHPLAKKWARTSI